MFEKYKENKERLCSYVNNWIAVAKEMKEEKLAEELELQLSQLQDLRFNIAVVGNQKRGKSTLINTLLGRRDDKLSPIDWKVCTGGVVHYMNQECDAKKRGRECADAYFKNGEIEEDFPLSSIGDYIREENNKDNHKGLSRVEVFGDFPRLHDCCLVDTPGADAVVEHHQEVAFRFMPHADAIIMTTIADQPLSDADQDILKALDSQGKKRIFYLVTMIDDEREEDRDKILRHVSDMIVKCGLPRPEKLYPIACKPVFDAMKAGDDAKAAEMRKTWGVDELERDLESFITSESRTGRNICDTLLNLLARLKAALNEKKKFNEEFIKIQDVDVEKIKGDCAAAKKDFETFRKGVERKIADFERKWDNSARRLVEGIDSFSTVLKEKMVAYIEKEGMIRTIVTLFSQNQILKCAMQEPISRYLEEHSAKLQKLINDLGCGINDEVKLYRTHMSELNIPGSLGGLAVVGTAGWIVSASGVATAVTGAIEAGILLAEGLGVGGGIGTAFLTLSNFYVFIGAAVGAIVPLAIALLAVASVGPLGRVILKLLTPQKVDKALKDTKDAIQKQVDDCKARIVKEVHQEIDDADAKCRAILDELEAKLADISPEAKAQAEEENQHIAALLQEREPEERALRSQSLLG